MKRGNGKFYNPPKFKKSYGRVFVAKFSEDLQ